MQDLRKHINTIIELNEAPVKPSKEKVKTKVDFADPTSKGQVAKATQKVDLPGAQRTSAQTAQDVSRAQMPTGAGEVMGRFMQMVGDIEDPVQVARPAPAPTPTPTPTPGIPEPKIPTTLPALISQAVAVKKEYKPMADINWHKISDLPGYAVSQIRGAFRPLFHHLTGRQLEEINVATTLTSGKQSIKELVGFLAKNGRKDDSFSLEAFDIDPDLYHVNRAYLYNWGGHNWFIMEERLMGMQNWYIYAAPEKEPKYGTEIAQQDLLQIK